MFKSCPRNQLKNSPVSYTHLDVYKRQLMDTGGNSGGQASVTVIRAMSLGDIEFADWLRVIWKELRVAVLCALTLAAVVFAKVMLLDRKSAVVALVVALTILVTIIIAKLVAFESWIISRIL